MSFTGNCYFYVDKRCHNIVIGVKCWYLACPLSVVTTLSFIYGNCASRRSSFFLWDSSSFITAKTWNKWNLNRFLYKNRKIRILQNKDRSVFRNNTYEAPAHRWIHFPDGSINMHPWISTLGALQTSSYGSPSFTVMDSWLALRSTCENTPENM